MTSFSTTRSGVCAAPPRSPRRTAGSRGCACCRSCRTRYRTRRNPARAACCISAINSSSLRPSLPGADHDRRAVRVVGTDVDAPVAAQLLEAHPDVGLDVLDQVAEMDRAVGVGQGCGDEDFALGHGLLRMFVDRPAVAAVGPAKGGPTKGGPTKGGPTKGGPTKGGPTKGGPTKGGIVAQPVLRGECRLRPGKRRRRAYSRLMVFAFPFGELTIADKR